MVKRTFVKTLSYAVMHMTIAIAVAYILSGSWAIAFAIGLIEPCVQTIAYFFHERAWHKIEQRAPVSDTHNSVIDSASPVTRWVEKILHRHK